jgi:hypothetical protein
LTKRCFWSMGYSTERLTECAKMAGRALEDDFLAHAA